MKIINSSDINFKDSFNELLERGKMDIDNVSKIVQDLINDIKINKNSAIKNQIAKFDNWQPISDSDLEVSVDDMKNAFNNLDNNLRDALQVAYDRIKSYHEKLLPKSFTYKDEFGNTLGQKVTPVDRAGLYIPGGKAAYPSSLLMNAIPAIVAGVKEIIVCTPAPNNELNELLLAACHLCGIKKVFKIGGASAIGAMAYGTQTIPKVDVITGPGNIFVATAKKLVYGEVNIDMIAGPSEIGIIADESARVDFLAMDLLSQAEHDEMASSILITNSSNLANEVKSKVYEFLNNLSRFEIAKKSIDNRGAIIVTKDLDEAVNLMNQIAPEHLEVVTKEPNKLLDKIKHAGAIFLGSYTPEPIGDYIAGPNHTLPTGGTAKFYSPLSCEHFVKKSSIISMSKEGISKIAKECALIAKAEGLTAHEKSVLIRIEE